MIELKAIESATAVIENVHLVYIKAQADKVIAELKAREDVLLTDNRDLLEKVKMLEERLHENAEHYKRNEAQIIENADKVIAEKDKEIAELKALNHDLCERVTENDEIRLHWEEIEQTRAENERMKARIAELEEERRWRKCCEGLPLKGQRVLFLAKYKTDKVREWIGDFRHIDGMKEDFAVFYTSAPGWGCEFLIDEVIGWMPLPSAPKEEK